MRRWLHALTVTLLASTSLFASVTLHVTVKDEENTAIDGAMVYALVFTNNGPDAVNSRVGVTVDGAVDLSLADGLDYEIFYTKDGYTPTLRNQFSSPDPALHHHVMASGSPDPLPLTLRSGGTVSGTVAVNVSNASSDSMLFGQIFNGNNREDVAMGACLTNGGGACLLTFLNVPAASANTYRVNAHDPTLNRGNEVKVTHALAKFGSVGPYALDISGGLPPETTDRQNGPQPSGDASLQGVVTSTDNIPIPFFGVSFQSPTGPGSWGQTDQNGRFTFYGLTSGSTYYAQVFAGCNQVGCFEGYSSPAAASQGTEVGPKDIVFDSASAPMKVRIQIPRASAGTGEMPIDIVDQNGDPLPGGTVNLWPDGRAWHTNAAQGCSNNASNRSNPGLANISAEAPSGHVTLTDLPPGNYILNVWSPFSSQGVQFNGGPDGEFAWNWSIDCDTPPHADDLRVTIDSMTIPSFRIYDSSGVDTNQESVIVRVNTLQPYADHAVDINLTFPEAVDLSSDPILVTLQECGDNGCSGAYHQFNTGPLTSFNFELAIATGNYWVNVQSKYWGIVREGGGQGRVVVDENNATNIPLRFKFAKAGRVKGFLYKPDGSLYTPGQGSGASVSASMKNGNSWGYANVARDGSFVIGGLLPGTYQLRINGWGTFDLANPIEPVSVAVVADQDSYAEVRTVNGVKVLPSVNLGEWDPAYSLGRSGPDSDSRLKTVYFPAGTKLAGAKLLDLMTGGDQPNILRYQAAEDENGQCGPGWVGFCPGSVEAPKAYDFYLFRNEEFRPGGTSYQQLSPLAVAKNVVVSEENASESVFVQGSTISVVPIDLTPAEGTALGEATIRGDLTAATIFREADFVSLGGDFNNFIKFIPILTLFNAAGEVQAVGMVTPRPEEFNEESDMLLQTEVAGGNWDDFKALFDTFHFSYKIMGLDPNTTYAAVVTTPNYPPIKVSVRTGANGSTTLQSFNLDDAVGSGATITGIVSSGATPLANASVIVKSPGIETKTLTTDANGRYTLEALPNGSYRLTALASGFAPDVKSVDVTQAVTVTRNFSLVEGEGIIRGSVYKRRFPSPQVLVGATVVAYDDTQNGQNPSDPLYLYSVKTSSMGVYELSGLVVGHDYRISLAVPGKYVLSETTTSAVSPVEGIDFTLQSKALDVDVTVRKRTEDFEFIINNPAEFASGEVRLGTDPFDQATSTDISNTFDELPNKQLVAHLPFAGLSQGVNYLLRIEAESYAGDSITKDVPFSLADKGYAEKQIDLALLGDETENSQGRAANEVMIDESGADPSGIVIPVGGMLTSTGSVSEVPQMSFAKVDRDNTEVDAVLEDIPAGGTLSSDVYTLALENVNLTEKGFNVTLGFDADADWSDLGAYQYNPTTGEWDLVSGVQTIDPNAGTIHFNVTDLSGEGAGAPRRSRTAPASSLRASFNGKHHSIRIGAASGTGQFAIMRVTRTAGTTFTGTKFKVFNFPNPFNLKAKAVPVTDGGATTSIDTNGTVIKYEVPSSVATGQVVIRIYSLSGELVRELHEGDQAGGYYYYTAWDGKNKDGKEVANGVYYGVVSMPGVNVKDARFKLAVVK
jgi:hypothetical protein